MKSLSLLGVFCCLAICGSFVSVAASVDGYAAYQEPDRGKKAFQAYCAECHALPAENIESKTKDEKLKGPDLPNHARPHDEGHREWLWEYIRKEAELDDKSHTPVFTGSDEDMQAIIDWLCSLEPLH